MKNVTPYRSENGEKKYSLMFGARSKTSEQDDNDTAANTSNTQSTQSRGKLIPNQVFLGAMNCCGVN